nr:MAG: helix-turn-helix domain protein [Bacteriophage sp.]UWI28730.1 MAG: helix-turn-helix domain protein [Bacteriophage sp.]
MYKKGFNVLEKHNIWYFLMWDKIEKQLKIKGWSMYRLAKESGVHPSNFSNLKAGRLKEMSWTNMCKLADALEVSLDEFR